MKEWSSSFLLIMLKTKTLASDLKQSTQMTVQKVSYLLQGRRNEKSSSKATVPLKMRSLLTTTLIYEVYQQLSLVQALSRRFLNKKKNDSPLSFEQPSDEIRSTHLIETKLRMRSLWHEHKLEGLMIVSQLRKFHKNSGTYHDTKSKFPLISPDYFNLCRKMKRRRTHHTSKRSLN